MAKEKKEAKKTRRPTAQKREIQNSKKRARNKAFKSQVRTAIRGLDDAFVKKDETKVQEKLKTIYSLMDTGVQKGLYKLNKAKRIKSRYASRAKAI